jgi:hypothetical protein
LTDRLLAHGTNERTNVGPVTDSDPNVELGERRGQVSGRWADGPRWRGVHHLALTTGPNGISLEASHWVIDVTGRDADHGDRLVAFTDRRPVPALIELEKSGDLDWTPRTHLLGESAE